MHHNHKYKPYTPSIKTVIHLAKMTIPFMPNSRGAVVRWLERLGYGAGKRRKS